jgi:hypothetical protein
LACPERLEGGFYSLAYPYVLYSMYQVTNQ